jgi:hypothetical protein
MLVLAPALLALAACGARAPAQMAADKGGALKADMRKLWEDHIAWTRMYIVSAAANLPEKEATAARLMKNQEDIGNAIKPYYGDPAGTQLTGLLKSHITIATEIIDAAMKGDNPAKDDAARRWGANADDIAGLLSGANPTNWPLPEMKQMLHDHLDLTTQEVVAHLGKDWAGSIAAYDRIHEQMLTMADALSGGIEKQFPDRVM